SLTAIAASRAIVEALADDVEPHYGISTGFGALATKHIPVDRRTQLQRSLVRSHAAGSGPEVEREVVRGLMLLRLSTLATGHTGVRRETAQLLAGLLTHGITPVVREYGSLGCSGHLAPRSHCALALMGAGQLATDRVFAPELQAIRPHPGQALSAANLTAVLRDSGVVASHRGPDCNRVQDAYSLRCSPQVHGAARDTVEHAATVASIE